MGTDNFKGEKGWPIALPAVSCAKMAEPIEMLFGIWTWVGPRKHVLDWDAHWHHLGNTIELSMCGGKTVCCQITLTTDYYISLKVCHFLTVCLVRTSSQHNLTKRLHCHHTWTVQLCSPGALSVPFI